MNRLNKLWDALCVRFANWQEKRKRKAMLRRNVCPACGDERHGIPCMVCAGIKIRPFTPSDRVTIRDRYKALTGIDLFD